MKPTVKPEGPLEHFALWANLAPYPIVESMYGMIVCRVIMAGVRLKLYESLSKAPASARELAESKTLDHRGVALLLDGLCAVGHLRKEGDAYALKARAKKWLDPGSPTYIGGFLEFNYDQWEWWSRLEEVVRTGKGIEIHAFERDDPRWERYITAMYQLARLSAPEVARALRLPPSPTRILDLAGGHGWFAAEICRRYPSIKATVLDLPGSVAVGRKIISHAGMSDRVAHVDGDLLKDDLGGPYDCVLGFQIVHHLTPEQNQDLFRRIRASLKPGGLLAILDYFAPETDTNPDAASLLGLHFYLTSSAATYPVNEILEWLDQAGFPTVRKIRLKRVPIQILLKAR
jgi:SAM-dependent methyltransferase